MRMNWLTLSLKDWQRRPRADRGDGGRRRDRRGRIVQPARLSERLSDVHAPGAASVSAPTCWSCPRAAPMTRHRSRCTARAGPATSRIVISSEVRSVPGVATAAPVFMTALYEDSAPNASMSVSGMTCSALKHGWRISGRFPRQQGDLLVGADAARRASWRLGQSDRLAGCEGGARHGRRHPRADGRRRRHLRLHAPGGRPAVFHHPRELTHILVGLTDPDRLDHVVSQLRGCDAGLDMNVVPLAHLFRTIQTLVEFHARVARVRGPGRAVHRRHGRQQCGPDGGRGADARDRRDAGRWEPRRATSSASSGSRRCRSVSWAGPRASSSPVSPHTCSKPGYGRGSLWRRQTRSSAGRRRWRRSAWLPRCCSAVPRVCSPPGARRDLTDGGDTPWLMANGRWSMIGRPWTTDERPDQPMRPFDPSVHGPVPGRRGRRPEEGLPPGDGSGARARRRLLRDPARGIRRRRRAVRRWEIDTAEPHRLHGCPDRGHTARGGAGHASACPSARGRGCAARKSASSSSTSGCCRP